MPLILRWGHYWRWESESLPNSVLAGNSDQTAPGTQRTAERVSAADQGTSSREPKIRCRSHSLLSLGKGTRGVFSQQVKLEQPLLLLCVTTGSPQANAKVWGLLYTGRMGRKNSTNQNKKNTTLTQPRKHQLLSLYIYIS